jgi:hypothetical protein
MFWTGYELDGMSSYKCNGTSFSFFIWKHLWSIEPNAKVWKDGISSMDDILELPKRNWSLLLST